MFRKASNDPFFYLFNIEWIEVVLILKVMTNGF
jgi:hypothetical protein